MVSNDLAKEFSTVDERKIAKSHRKLVTEPFLFFFTRILAFKVDSTG